MNVLITGASRGIGRAIAAKLAGPGVRVVVNYLQNKAAAQATADLVTAAGGDPLLVQGDVRSEKDLKELARALPSVDVLVHNAAVGALKPYDKMRSGHWDLTLESSLRPFWLLTKHANLADGANIIGISSMGSQRFIPGYAAMGAAKGGLEALTRQLAVELAPRGIRVNTVCGGLIDTDSLKYLHEGEKMAQIARDLTPLGRIGTPDDIAGVVHLLIQPEARWMTGQVVVVDGGLSLL